MLRILWLCVLLPALASAQSLNFAPVSARVQALVQQQNLPGASVLILRDDSTLYEQAFGGYTLQTRVPIGSASKWLSAAVIARLVDRGVMRWDDRIDRYLPDAPADKRAITLRQLFSHSAGLPGESNGCLGNINLALQDCVNEILALPLAYPPGQGFAYGGLSMQVAGRLAEIASGQRWDDLFRAEVATPLGLTQTDYAFFSTVPGYVAVSNPRIAGGVRTTLGDYGRFLHAILARGANQGQSWLSPALIDQMAEDQTRGAPILSTPLPGAYGYGIGQWRERVDSQGRALLLSSPGAFGFYPVIDRELGYAGIFLTRNSLSNVATEVQALWVDVGTILRQSTPQPPRLLLQQGYGGGWLAPGSRVSIAAEAPGTRMLVGWRGDSPQLADPRAWHAPWTQAERPATLTAQFQPAPALNPVLDSINSARVRYQLPSSVRGLVFSFHGSGGSGDLPFSKTEAQVSTRLWLSRGFGVVGLDSVDRVNRQWNLQLSLSNPDVVNVSGILTRLRALGLISQSTPIYCEGSSNGGGFCSRVSALLGMRAQSLMIADGVEAILAQVPTPTIWTLGRNDPTLTPGYLERSQASADSLAARGVAWERNVVEPTPVYPERFARIEGISLSDSIALSSSLRTAGFLDASGYVIQDPRSNALDALIPTTLRAYTGEIVGQMEAAYGGHEYTSDYAHRVVHFFEAQLAPNYTGLWWKLDEPGWGLSIAHQGNSLFPVWYTFDRDGRPAWLVGGALVPGSDGVFRGPAYRVSGTPYSQINGPVQTESTLAGSFALQPGSDGSLSFSSEIDGIRQTRRIERTRFGRLPACRFSSESRALGANRSDIWWNPREPGWGAFLAEQDQTLVLAWYTFGPDRRPIWLLASLARDVEGRYRGALTRPTSGTPFDLINGAATAFPVPAVGEASIEFVDGQRGLLRYRLDGVEQTRDLERYVYAGPTQSDCQ